MRLTNRRHGSKLELQMTSMIDCVFLLLIFFMVTSSFNRAERELDTGITNSLECRQTNDLDHGPRKYQVRPPDFPTKRRKSCLPPTNRF